MANRGCLRLASEMWDTVSLADARNGAPLAPQDDGYDIEEYEDEEEDGNKGGCAGYAAFGLSSASAAISSSENISFSPFVRSSTCIATPATSVRCIALR